MDRDDPRLLTLLDRLYRVSAKAHAIDSEPRAFDTAFPLTRAEVHTLSDIVDAGGGLGITALADLQGVTKGAASQMTTRLQKKGLVEKRRSGGRDVELHPTGEGLRAHRAHMAFHRRISAFLASGYPDAATVERDTEALDRLLGLMDAWQRIDEG